MKLADRCYNQIPPRNDGTRNCCTISLHLKKPVQPLKSYQTGIPNQQKKYRSILPPNIGSFRHFLCFNICFTKGCTSGSFNSCWYRSGSWGFSKHAAGRGFLQKKSCRGLMVRSCKGKILENSSVVELVTPFQARSL